jgi:hypothetical protein
MIAWTVKSTKEAESQKEHWALCLNRGYGLEIGHALRADLWSRAEVQRIAQDINNLRLPVDSTDLEIVAQIRAAQARELQLQCDRQNAH